MAAWSQRREPVATGYSEEHDPDLPWGYWMLQVDGPRRGVIDDDGRFWQSLRLAFWCGRMGMHEGPWIGEHLELLIAMLSSAARGFDTGNRELSSDVFGGSPVWQHHYRSWLIGRGLLHSHDTFSTCLTDEGWAALLMLKATRPEELIDMEPGSEAIELAGGPAMAAIANPAVNLAGARFRFERGTLGRQQLISLLDRDGGRGRMPMVSTIWSMAFEGTEERDRLYAWMCARSDRWQAWGKVAREGADGLTQHLLATYIASVDWREVNGGAPVLAITDGTAKPKGRKAAA